MTGEKSNKGPFDAVVAGAGIWGCTLARALAEKGERVRILERRPVVGGNVRCETDAATGIEVHAYGSHIFHTHDRAVWDFVRRFTEFNGYQHKVLANYRGKIYHLPLGLTLINKFFGVELKPSELDAFLNNERRQAIFDAFFRGYTSKQWGRPPEEIDPSIIRRVPVRDNYDTNYFNDYWQGIPSDGYNRLFERILEHENIGVELGVDFDLETAMKLTQGGARVFYSGPLDRLFGYRFGALPWRSLRFETERIPVADFQGTSVMNYTEVEIPYTRIHEFKHYHPEQRDVMTKSATIIMREYPSVWKPGDEPYYPVNSPESAALLARYREEAERIPNLVVGGRLGAYRYYDMDQAVASALAVAGAR